MIHASVFVVVLAVGLGYSSALDWSGVVISLLIALLIVGFFILFPQIMFKPQMRTLTVSKNGIETSIGKMDKHVDWKEINKIENSGETIAIIRKNLNAFLVPRRAFGTEQERNDFLTKVTEWKSRTQ